MGRVAMATRGGTFEDPEADVRFWAVSMEIYWTRQTGIGVSMSG